MRSNVSGQYFGFWSCKVFPALDVNSIAVFHFNGAGMFVACIHIHPFSPRRTVGGLPSKVHSLGEKRRKHNKWKQDKNHHFLD